MSQHSLVFCKNKQHQWEKHIISPHFTQKSGKKQMRIPALNPTVFILPPRGYWELSARELLNSSLLHAEPGQQLLWEPLPVMLSDV